MKAPRASLPHVGPAALAVFMGLAGCPDPSAEPPVEPAPKPNDEGDAGPPDDPDVVVTCEGATQPASLDAMADRFADEIHPLMTREAGGCVACHAQDSERLLKMADSSSPTAGRDTFFRVRAGGFLRLTAGGMPERVLNESMPEGGPAWSQAEKDALVSFSCDLALVDEGGIPPDEEFPPDLLSPYTGAPITDYDNTFLTYDQLRGRVLQQFDDEWVREGVDQFSENISLFGGVDFVRAFVPARQATPEFFVGLDLLAEDVCARAANDGTGPFAGLDLDAAIADEPASTTQTFEAEAVTYNNPAGCAPGPNATNVVLCTTGDVQTEVTLPAAGDYIIRALVRGQPNPGGPPNMEIRVDSDVVLSSDVPETTFVERSVTTTIAVGGSHILSVAFTNDSTEGGDRNMFVDRFSIEGPLPGSTDGSPTGRADATALLRTIFERTLLRPARETAALDEIEPLYTLLVNLEAFDGDRRGAFAGVCQGLLNHPDFLFTRAPTFDEVTGGERERLLVIKTALDLLDRTPTAEELGRFDVGETREALLDEWLASDTFRSAYFNRVRQVLEYDGTPDGDEPARLWTYVTLNDRPLKEVLTASYTVDEAFQPADRPAEHGETGLLTMKGYIKGKPGLPHYNYAARVLTGFMGVVFEVPQEALDARATATAASTVDPTSICFSCHQLLTPLAHQRLRWDDDGNYRTTFDDGRPIDDSDQSLVEVYPFRGPGLESFSLVAVRKEGFIRRMVNVHFLLSFGRNLRHDLDERDVYLELWNAAESGNGNFRAVIRTILSSRSYTDPPAPAAAGGAP